MFENWVNQSAKLLDSLGLKSSLWPKYRCYFCRQEQPDTSLCCSGCYRDLPWLLHFCPRCAEPLPKQAKGLVCARCLKRPPAFDLTRAPLRYELPIIKAVQRLKSLGDPSEIRLATDLFLARFQQEIEQQPPSLLIPVPLHYYRALQRGHNQSYEWGLALAEQLHLTIAPDYCTRTLPTPHQQGLTAKARRKNLQNAFALRPSIATIPEHVAIIDDVLTTGSTANALARVLRKAGAKKIEVWCLARTPIQPS